MKMIADKRSYLSGLRTELERAFPDNRTIHIVVHGHSQTRGYTTGHVIEPFDAYPHQFHVLLKKSFPFAATNVISTGIGGECAINGAKRMESDVFCHKPDLLLIDYALNDRYADFSESMKAWKTMTVSARDRGILVLLLTPTLDIPSAYQKKELALIEKHEDMIRTLGDAESVGVAEVTCAWRKYLENGGNIEDLLCSVNHASVLGHSIIARECMSWIPQRMYKE